MDLILIILGIAGSAAIVIAAYVVAVTSRNYASQAKKRNAMDSANPALRLVPRSSKDRLMSASGYYTTYALGGNGGGLTDSGVEKVTATYKSELERIQKLKKEQVDPKA